MKRYIKAYYLFFRYDLSDFVPSEITGERAVDINHIDAKGMGGSKTKDGIENLIALTRSEHEYFGDKRKYKDWLREVHQSYIEIRLSWAITNPDCPVLNEYFRHEAK